MAKRVFVCATCGSRLLGQQVGGHRRANPGHDIEEILKTGEKVTWEPGVFPTPLNPTEGSDAQHQSESLSPGEESEKDGEGFPKSSKISAPPVIPGGVATVRYDIKRGKFFLPLWISIDSLFKYHWLRDGRSGYTPYTGKLEDFVEWAINDAFQARGLQVPSAVMDPKLIEKMYSSVNPIETHGPNGKENGGQPLMAKADSLSLPNPEG